jgi:hypothetical protein
MGTNGGWDFSPHDELWSRLRRDAAREKFKRDVEVMLGWSGEWTTAPLKFDWRGKPVYTTHGITRQL